MSTTATTPPAALPDRLGRRLCGLGVLSFLAAVGLGLLDHETQGLVHLFTAELGNLVGLAMYTGIFFVLGFPFVIGWTLLRRSA
ncbi:MAG: hypothetical protein AAF533_18720 [Acidobacteriota bacterium]